jgi:hypothetical protein
MYVGPDRRRFNSAEYRGARKRQSDALDVDMQAGVQTAASTMRNQLTHFAEQPRAALSAMLTVAAELEALPLGPDEPVSTTIASLKRHLQSAFEYARLSPPIIERHLDALQALASEDGLPPEARKRLLLDLQDLAA